MAALQFLESGDETTHIEVPTDILQIPLMGDLGQFR